MLEKIRDMLRNKMLGISVMKLDARLILLTLVIGLKLHKGHHTVPIVFLETKGPFFLIKLKPNYGTGMSRKIPAQSSQYTLLRTPLLHGS